MSNSSSCLYSTVKNISGRQLPCGFLPPHGRTLAIGEEFTVFGDIRQALIKFDRNESRRNIISFEAALLRHDIDIINTPATILEDNANPGAGSKMEVLHNGSLALLDPCWKTPSSNSPSLGDE